MEPIALVCTVELEASPVRRRIQDGVEVPQRGGTAVRGWIGATPVVLLVCGMGKTNAAHALTALLERVPVSGVIGFGVGGAYPGSGLDVGDLALASAEHYGDEGVETVEGWMSTEGIGIPLVDANGSRYFNDFPMAPEMVRRAGEALAGAGHRVEVGPFVTVSACSGTDLRGHQLAERFGAVCETMEGAAYAHIATLYRLPVLELRGISNRVENRDLSRWKLAEAASAAAAGVEIMAREWYRIVTESSRDS